MRRGAELLSRCRSTHKKFGKAMEKTNPVEESVDPSAGQSPGSGASVEDLLAAPAADLAAVVAERDQLKAEKEEFRDRWLRLAAEFDNFRKRSLREQSESFDRAALELVAGLLPAVDDFERALKVETADAEYAKGIELIYQRLLETLKRAGLEPLETKGAPFDPNLHEALGTVPTEEVADHTVYDELRKGYHLRGRLLRPAMVRVAVTPQEQK